MRCRHSWPTAVAGLMTVSSLWIFAFVAFESSTPALKAQDDLAEQPARAGRNFIETKIYSKDEDERVLSVFRGLRVADVSDGLDAAGLSNICLMDPQIAPLWRDTKTFRHRIIGIAVTARYVPSSQPLAREPEAERFDAWVGAWYRDRSPETFKELLRPGSVLVLDDAASRDVGSIGSNNIMSWVLAGCVGVITNAGARDTDEIITERVPLYFRQPGRGIRPGRNELESINRPIVCGGVLVRPGDVIVADGDGVVVVPRERAEEVASYAQKILEGDKAGRRRLYDRLGLPQDPSVK